MPTRNSYLPDGLTVAEFAACGYELPASISEEARKVGLDQLADLIDAASAEAATAAVRANNPTTH